MPGEMQEKISLPGHSEKVSKLTSKKNKREPVIDTQDRGQRTYRRDRHLARD